MSLERSHLRMALRLCERLAEWDLVRALGSQGLLLPPLPETALPVVPLPLLLCLLELLQQLQHFPP